jgi:hypothetical protein
MRFSLFVVTDCEWSSFEMSSMVTVRVGKDPEAKSFIANEALLTSHSEFFRRAMNGRWEEASTRTVKLPEDRPEDFVLYLSYLHNGYLPTMTMSQDELMALGLKEMEEALRPEYDSLIHLYVLVDKLQDRAAKNAIVKAVFETTEQNKDGK